MIDRAQYKRDYNNRRYHNEIKPDPRRRLMLSTKSSASKRKLSHTISEEDLVIPETCPILKISLKLHGREPNSISVDRIYNDKGYVPGNVQIISNRANKLKNNGTLEEFRKIVKYLEGLSTQNGVS